MSVVQNQLIDLRLVGKKARKYIYMFILCNTHVLSVYLTEVLPTFPKVFEC